MIQKTSLTDCMLVGVSIRAHINRLLGNGVSIKETSGEELLEIIDFYAKIYNFYASKSKL
jgi:hypothetical protein